MLFVDYLTILPPQGNDPGAPPPPEIAQWGRAIAARLATTTQAAARTAGCEYVAASAASAALDHVRTWFHGTAEGDWTSMGIVSDGSYGVPEGLVSSFPVTTKDGDYQIVQGLELNEFSRGRVDASVAELASERDEVAKLGLI